MTTKELELLEIYQEFPNSKIYPDRYYIPCVAGGFVLRIKKEDTMADIYQKIYEAGFEKGEEDGKQQKIIEIKRVLGID